MNTCQPKMLKKEDIKEGAVIIDVGINRVDADNEKGYVIVGLSLIHI